VTALKPPSAPAARRSGTTGAAERERERERERDGERERERERERGREREGEEREEGARLASFKTSMIPTPAAVELLLP
jgi:hypothetical protein